MGIEETVVVQERFEAAQEINVIWCYLDEILSHFSYKIKAIQILEIFAIIRMTFAENVKPMIVNSTNAKTIEKLYKTPYIEEWKGRKIQLFVCCCFLILFK